MLDKSVRTGLARAASYVRAPLAALGLVLVLVSATRPPDVATPTLSSLQDSRLAVFASGKWRTWWSSRNSPRQWRSALPLVATAVKWQRAASDGVEWGSLRIAGTGEAWRLRVLLARIDPHEVRFELDKALREDSLAGAWTVDSAPPNAVLAIDAGQFSYGRPWGLVVREGRQEQPPGRGPLSTTISFDSAGGVSLIDGGSAPSVSTTQRVEYAFQSYPTILTGDGDVPPVVAGTTSGIDVEHRDSRLAICQLRDGRLLVALTRFDALNGVLSAIPFGPTVPEMAAIMGALGCRSAVMLDGGISGQMLFRDSTNTAHVWRGWRKVPMGLVVLARHQYFAR